MRYELFQATAARPNQISLADIHNLSEPFSQKLFEGSVPKIDDIANRTPTLSHNFLKIHLALKESRFERNRLEDSTVALLDSIFLLSATRGRLWAVQTGASLFEAYRSNQESGIHGSFFS